MDNELKELYYFNFIKTNRTYVGFTLASAVKLEEVDQEKFLIVPVSISASIISELINEGICADFREEDPTYLYLGYETQDPTSPRHYIFTPELKYNTVDGTIIFIEEEERTTTMQVIGG